MKNVIITILTKKSRFPYGKYTNYTIEQVLQSNNSTVLSYLKWWDNTIKYHKFDDDIKTIIKTRIDELKYIQDKYAAEELYRDKTYDDCETNNTPSKGWDLPIDDKPLEYYLYLGESDY